MSAELEVYCDNCHLIMGGFEGRIEVICRECYDTLLEKKQQLEEELEELKQELINIKKEDK